MMKNKNLIGAMIRDHSVRVYDDSYGELFAYGQEYGPTMLIRAKGIESAYEIVIDESHTIKPGELPEAYGFYLTQCKSYNRPDNGEPWRICSDHDDHGMMVSEKILHCTGDRLCIGGEFATRADAEAYCMQYVADNEIELVEGYSYQSNSTDTGIVSVGDYEWIRPLAEFNRGLNFYDQLTPFFVCDDCEQYAPCDCYDDKSDVE